MSEQISIMGVWEAAEFLGMTKQGLHYKRQKDPEFPDPIEQLRSGPVWTRDQLEAYRKLKVGRVGALNPRDARRALEISRKHFAFYAQQHRGKLDNSESLSPAKIEETLQKESVNVSLVNMLDAVLRGEKPEWPDA